MCFLFKKGFTLYNVEYILKQLFTHISIQRNGKLQLIAWAYLYSSLVHRKYLLQLQANAWLSQIMQIKGLAAMP